MLSSLGLLMDRRMAEIVGDVVEEVETEVVAVEAAEAAVTTLALSFGEERLGSVRLGEGSGSEIGEELVKG